MVRRSRYTKARRSRRIKIIFGSVIILIAAIILMSVATFCSHDPSPFYFSSGHDEIYNAFGIFGSYVAAYMLYVFGHASYLLSFLLAFVGYLFCFDVDLYDEIDRLLSFSFCIGVIGALLYRHQPVFDLSFAPGGYVGMWVYEMLSKAVDPFSALIVLYGILACLICVIARVSCLYIVRIVLYSLFVICIQWRIWVLPIFLGLKGFVMFCVIRPMRALLCWLWRTIRVNGSQVSQFAFEQAGISSMQDGSVWNDVSNKNDDRLVTSQKNISSSSQVAHNLGEKKYKLPRLALFIPSDKNVVRLHEADQRVVQKALEEKLSRFGIEGRIVSIHVGPVVTLFEYEPHSDVKISRITALEHDLALALQAVSVRIVAPIPGTPRVGFEVANKKRIPVRFADLVRSLAFQKHQGALPVILGCSTSGKEVIIDLVHMPHMLIAGSTGSGKSVALNTMILSLLCKRSPDELKMVIIDPKRLDFALYHDIGHLLVPIVTEASRAILVLKWLVKVMEERYEKMASLGVRNIDDYNVQEDEKLPYIVVFIDELADLMMVARKEIEDNIARLAQMARAAGIHLILATQRPSVDVLTGIIKVNFPSRISFKVSSKIDSRTILDTLGAESLLGKGDMLLSHVHLSGIQRVHGGYVPDAEIQAVTDFVRVQRKPHYIDLRKVAEKEEQYEQESDDLMPHVIQFLNHLEGVSISLIQRKFHIGYNRAARIIEALEAQGKILPSDGGKLRKIIK